MRDSLPAALVNAETLPLNPSGNLDQSGVPPLDRQNTFASDDNPISDRFTIRQQIAVMVADLLGLEKVEDDDNFFMLGGHSLLGTQLIIRIRDTFGVDLSLRALFGRPTVAGICAEIERSLAR